MRPVLVGVSSALRDKKNSPSACRNLLRLLPFGAQHGVTLEKKTVRQK